MLTRKLVHQMTCVLGVSENVGVEKREGNALVTVGALFGTLLVPLSTIVGDGDYLLCLICKMLLMTQTIFTIDEALAVDIALVP